MTSPARTHQALYRRWRAQTFGEIVGQEPVVQTLQNAVRSNQVAHGLLFVGPRGTGKTSMARIVAKALNCANLVDGEPDDSCEACVSIREGRALDVIEMDAASNNKVDDIRDFLPRVATLPSSLRRKVFIVDEVQRIKEGWDLLLKTLEEPPDHVAFIFCTTDASQVRPAVLSRIQRFDFRPLTATQIEGKLRRVLEAEGRTADEDAISLVARLAAGGMRDAESMLDQLLTAGQERLSAEQVRELLGLVDADTVSSFIEALVAGDALAGMRILATLEDRGRDLRAFLNQVVEGMREAIVERLSTGVRGDSDTLAAAARRLASIDPSRSGPGGLRFQLELAVLVPVAAPLGANGTSARAEGTPIRPRLTERTGPPRPAAAIAPPANVPPMPPEPAAAADVAPRSEMAAPADVGSLSKMADPADVAPRREIASRPEVAVPPDIERPPEVAAASDVAARRRAVARPEVAGSANAAAQPEVGRSSVDPEPAKAQPAPVPTAGDAPLDSLYRIWPDIVAWISKMPAVKPLIIVCRPIAMDGNVITLGFPESQAFLKDVAERRRATLEEGVAQFLGRPVAVRCVATNLELAPPAPPDQEAERLLAEARRIFADDLVDIGEVH